MNPRERVQAVYQGKVPDQVPLMLDLSHWHKANHAVRFDLNGYQDVDQKLVDLHKKLPAVCYIEMGRFFDMYFDGDEISAESWTDDKGVYHQRICTPLGELCERRVFEPISYSYNIEKHLINGVEDFQIVCYIMQRYHCRAQHDRYFAWAQALGDCGFPYCNIGYSGLGYLISRHLGVEKTSLATYDSPDECKSVIDAINACQLRVLDAVLDGPAQVIMLSDNLDGNVQNPRMFAQYSKAHYTELARRIHTKGKYFAVHVDGEMRGCLENMAQCGVDCIDAATPAPMFNLTPQQARRHAGPDLILSGGIPATVFGSQGTDQEFVAVVRRWLDTRKLSPRLIMAAGDQVPPDASWDRIAMLPELVAEYGRY